eukprot:14866676-Heterocapsa_arctica.AAC.1
MGMPAKHAHRGSQSWTGSWQLATGRLVVDGGDAGLGGSALHAEAEAARQLRRQELGVGVHEVDAAAV